MARPLKFRLYTTKSIRTSIRRLIAKAEKRRTKRQGNLICDKILQHLVGAKLFLLLGDMVEMHGASVSDSVLDRAGDFIINDVVIHVTTAPSEALMRKCAKNLDNGKRPLILTIYKNVSAAEFLAEQQGIANRIDVFDIEQFLAGNLYELGRFEPQGRKSTFEKIVEAYNHIIDSCETDPSLKIETSAGNN